MTTILVSLLPACVSRYDRVDDVHPLSSECKDYAAFSKALAKQRDNGFSKRATMSMAGDSVGNMQDREILQQRYQTISDIVFAERLIDPDTAKVMGKIICEQKQQATWHELQDDDIPAVTAMIRTCRQNNITLVEVEACIIDRMQAYWRNDLIIPPGFNGS